MAINFLRSLVSQDLKRFKEGDVNLDLSYIRHNLIGNAIKRHQNSSTKISLSLPLISS